jgi:hypothetical protein
VTLPIVSRLRDTAARIQRQDSVHQGNLRRLLVEAADVIEDLRRGSRAPAPVEPRPRGPDPLDAVGVAPGQGQQGKISIREIQQARLRR